ncbi:MAG: hypothetical protein RSF67_00625 [Clostridia bacterium]
MSTIAAISTAIGNSGISIIRLSGKKSLDIIKKIFTNYNKLKPNNIIYGKIKENNNIIDNVLVSYFKAPNSYTGEDVCEINCHGGIAVTNTVLDLVLKNGAVMADPGEFSKLAFLNGKIDLSKAEATIDLINSKTKKELEIASKALNGDIYIKVKELRQKLIEIISNIEVNIDYPEYDFDVVEIEKINKLIEYELNELNKLSSTYDQGKYIKNGVNIALVGLPNVR